MAVLVTGGTGAIGRDVVRLLLAEGRAVVVLTRDPGASVARALHGLGARLVRGDVTLPELGLARAEADALRGEVTRVIHCAAETSFTLPIERARATNVAGTATVLDFARRCARLEALVCASTVYVAGTRTGTILEADPGGAEHVNSYEQSKSEMEGVVREAMTALPLSLCRFSTVIGDSATGAVTSFNAIHHAIRLFYQGLAPMLPGDHDTAVDLIPGDFAARALHYLATQAFAPGRTYHLCAGAAGSLSLDELLSLTVAALERARPAWRKRRIARPAVVDRATYALFLRSVQESGNVVLQRATDAVQSFAWQLAYPKTFDTRQADAALAGSGIAAPHVRSYYEKVVAHCVETNWGRATPDGAAA